MLINLTKQLTGNFILLNVIYSTLKATQIYPNSQTEY